MQRLTVIQIPFEYDVEYCFNINNSHVLIQFIYALSTLRDDHLANVRAFGKLVNQPLFTLTPPYIRTNP